MTLASGPQPERLAGERQNGWSAAIARCCVSFFVVCFFTAVMFLIGTARMSDWVDTNAFPSPASFIGLLLASIGFLGCIYVYWFC